ADITAVPVTATVTAANKVYDGTTAATATCTLTGVLSGGTVTCSAAGATFASAAVGTGQTVTVTGITLSGAAASNYTLASPTATADITSAPPTVTRIGNLTTVIGTPTVLQVTASDPHGNPVQYAATGLPADVSIDSLSGVITGTPSALGTYSVTVTVTDTVLS